MIPEEIIYTNLAGASIELNEPTDPRFPMTNWDMQTYYVNDPVQKMQTPGEWPTFAYPSYRTFSITGDVKASTVALYNDACGDMKEVIQPPYAFYDVRRHGTLKLKFFGDATQYYAYVILVSLETPKEVDYPTVGQYMINWRSFEPYLRSVSGDAVTLRY